MDNDLQNITQKHEDLATRTPLKTGCELRSSGRVSNSRSTCGNYRITYCCQSGDVMNVKNSSSVIKTTLQHSHSNLITWRLVDAIVITWPLLGTTWVWNGDFRIGSGVMKISKNQTWIASDSILLSKRTQPCNMFQY